MKEINRTNYEAYFIDYLEGNLAEGMIDSFIAFLKANPDLKQELELYEPISLEPEKVSFNKKSELYKSKFDNNEAFDNAAIALLEGDLNEPEKQEFETYLASHPEKEKEATAFQNTKLKADESIVFADKKKLYKKAPGKTILLWTSRVAAVLILGFVVFNLVNRNNAVQENLSQQIAEVEKTPQQTIEETPVIVPDNDIKTNIAEKIEMEEPTPIEKISPKNPVVKDIFEKNSTTEAPEALLAMRETLIVPEKLNSITASIDVEQPAATLATMYIIYPAETYDDEMLLADRVKEKINLRSLSKAGLDLIASISDDRFEYETNNNGKVVNYTYESRLLAFSIPGKGEASE
ncbi:hypothetical protein SAMN05444285_103141 [Draconibacterium orientale]|jgi:hypothetical protein|uniref:Uncharacterized protein n=1 Tax=Draconibacterium orientale TaxID=1168034 RepID=X5DFQ8_9BACT|nr:hypothetical protein [Draconibacterium orientale]AHW61768.1 hypothetical protein FH5T_07975 [Draconibacterium orientale]SES92333.1 hypothetical protein SAMN05444285_103141 [Draconibacterium orientale]